MCVRSLDSYGRACYVPHIIFCAVFETVFTTPIHVVDDVTAEYRVFAVCNPGSRGSMNAMIPEPGKVSKYIHIPPRKIKKSFFFLIFDARHVRRVLYFKIF